MKVEQEAIPACTVCGVDSPHKLLYLSDLLRASQSRHCCATREDAVEEGQSEDLRGVSRSDRTGAVDGDRRERPWILRPLRLWTTGAFVLKSAPGDKEQNSCERALDPTGLGTSLC